MKTSIALFSAILSACTSGGLGDTTPTDKSVRANLQFSVEGVQYRGTTVVQRKSSQRIGVSVPDKAAKLILTTCHREEVYDFPPKDWSTLYQPAMFLENWGACPIIISVITQQGTLEHAVIDFSSNETMPATLHCNGTRSVSTLSVSFCQARVGLIQRIDFEHPMAVLASKGCPDLQVDGSSYEVAVAKGLCVYAFRSPKDGKTHRLTTRGYDALSAEVVKNTSTPW